MGGLGVTDQWKIQAELAFLAALESGEVVTQMTLSKRIAVSVGFVNAILKRAMRKGYVKASAAPSKRYAYYLTPKGFSEKSRLVAEYLEVSLDFFRRARCEYLELFLRAQASGHAKIIFAGGGELVEIAYSAMREGKLEAKAVFDPSATADTILGLPVVRTFEGLPEFDVIVLTETRMPQEMFERLACCVSDSRIIAPALLHIARTRVAFQPKVSSS